MTDLTADERRHVIRDIANWKVELEHTGGRSFSDDELDDYIEELADTPDDDLESWWYGSVGEWVASRQDMPVPEEMAFEDWLDHQFEKLKAGEETPWGYVVEVALPNSLA